jgi:4-amino-4-deoxy-L-arabinose transferase
MKAASFALVLVFIILYIVPLGVRPMVIPDETRYAEMSREMLASGDWVTPKLNGFRYFEKPVMVPWLNAVSISLFGENAFAIRLPSALSVGISALLIFFLVKSFGDGPKHALLASVAVLTCSEVFGVGTFCVLDSVFSMFVTATIVFFYFGWQRRADRGQKYLFLILAGVCCGLGFLTKGFTVFVLPVIVIFPFLLWERQWKELLSIGWVPLTAAVLVVLPWSLAIHMKEADFWKYFFWNEHVQRFLSPDKGQHSEPFWYYIPIILAGALPWSAWLVKAVSGLKGTGSKDSLIRLAICWVLFPFLFFSACGGKLGTYILPCFPPLAILLVTGFLRWHKFPGMEKKFARDLFISAILMAVTAIGLLVTQMGPWEKVRIYHSSESWKWLFIVVALLSYAAFLVITGRQKTENRRLVYYCLTPVALFFCVPFIVPDRVKLRKMPRDFLIQNKERIHPDTILISDNYLVTAICWFYKRDDVYLLHQDGEFDYGLSYEDSSHRLIEVDGFQEFIDKQASGSNVVWITRESRHSDYEEDMPKPRFEKHGDGFVLSEYP